MAAFTGAIPIRFRNVPNWFAASGLEPTGMRAAKAIHT